MVLRIIAKHLFGLISPKDIVQEAMCFHQMQIWELVPCDHVLGFWFLSEETFSWRSSPTPKKQTCSVFLIVLSRFLTFNLLTEACNVWDVAPGFIAVSEYPAVWISGEISQTSLPGTIGSRLECFSPLNNHSHYRMMGFKLFGNDLVTVPRLSKNFLCRIITDVFLYWHCVNTHLEAPYQQTAKNSVL